MPYKVPESERANTMAWGLNADAKLVHHVTVDATSWLVFYPLFDEEDQVETDNYGNPLEPWWCVTDYYLAEILIRVGRRGTARGTDYYFVCPDEKMARRFWEAFSALQSGECPFWISGEKEDYCGVL